MHYKHITKDERNEIFILLKKGYSHREIAGALGKHHSSVSREIKLNSLEGKYDSKRAYHKAYVKRKYSKYQGMKIRENSELEEYIEKKLKLDWSPEQITGRLKLETLGQISITPKTIYKYLYGSYGQYLCKYLKYKRYKKKRRKKIKSVREIIKDRVFIDSRPKIIDRRLRFEDFEADTLRISKGKKETLVAAIERKSGYFLTRKISRLKYAIDSLKEILGPVSPLSLTLDNGPENARYKELGIPTYFCHPYHSWEKGSIENALGLVREYIPKKSDLADYSDEEISVIVDIINNTPRKRLGFRTPEEVFKEHLLSQNANLLTLECRTSEYNAGIPLIFHCSRFKFRCQCLF